MTVQKQPLANRFKQILVEESVIKPKERVFVACSGGPDSTALSLLLSGLKSEGYAYNLLHYNHRLRKAADRDEAFVRALAAAQSVPVTIERRRLRLADKRLKQSPEEAARMWRYDFFCRAAKHHRIKKVILAHTLEDQAETVLMRVLQGTGARGLLGIRKTIELHGVTFYRPLLSVSKKEILDYLTAQKARYRVDASNRSTRYLRNRLRLNVIPYLRKEVNPKVGDALARIPQSLSEEQGAAIFLEKILWKMAVRVRGKKVIADRSILQGAPKAVVYRLLNRMLQCVNPQSGLNYKLWQDIQKNLGSARLRMTMPQKIDLVITQDRIECCRLGQKR